MDKNKIKTIEKLINDKSEAQLKGLVVELCKKFPDAYEYILLWGKATGSGGISVNEKLALEYWRKAERIIDDFNSYGGGPEDDEEEAYGYIEEVCNLISELSWKTRQQIMDGMLTQYHYSNSGFDDALTDACFEMCKEREEWLYLAEKLIGAGGNWDKTLVMNIYKIIGADEEYLKIRKKSLQYGMDYFELVKYYEGKRDVIKAVEYAHQGLEKGEGRVDDLVSYLFDYYEDKGNTDELENIFLVCERKKRECDFVSHRLFAYYKTRNDYENAKKYVLEEFKHTESHDLDQQYEKVKDYLNESDWLTVEDKLFSSLKKRNLAGYMRICLKKGLKQEVYDIITEKKITPWSDDYDFFADKLKKDFPEKIIEYYFRLAIYHVEVGANRKSYVTAMKYFKKAKEIYLKILKDEPRWGRKLVEIKERYKKRRAFLEEAKVLD